MSYKTCPDWPELMEIAPDLQFKHYTLAEAKLPGDALAHLADVALDEVEICCDLERHVYFARHTDPKVVMALQRSHWFDLTEWTTTGPGLARGKPGFPHEPPR